MGSFFTDLLSFQHETAVFDIEPRRMRFIYNTYRFTTDDEIRDFRPELVINADARAALEDAARTTDEARVAEALAAVRRCDEAISYNVSPETCIDCLLLEVRDALYGPRRAQAEPSRTR